MHWNANLDSGGVLVSDKITLEFELSLVKKIEDEVEKTAAEPVQGAESAQKAAPEQILPPPPITPTAGR